MSFSNYKNKYDFDDMHIMHQTKSPFKTNTFTEKDRQKNKRSSFVDCFTNDSIVAPTIQCPPGANCIKNKSHFSNDFNCPPGLHYSTNTYKCEPFSNDKKLQPLGIIKQHIAKNRKSSFFNSIVE